jgi:hypothetical protein
MSTTDLPHIVSDNAGILPGSLLGSLHAKREELAKRGTREIRKLVPLWDGALSVVYRYPEGGTDPIIRAVERAQASGKPQAAFDANADVLIACCHTVEGRQGDEDWEPLDNADGSPVRFTRKLADLLQIDVPDNLKSPARFIVRNVFSPLAASTGVYEGDISLMTQAGQVISWLNGAEQQADEALRGE